MAAAPRKSSSIITFRANSTIATPPMILGYENLIEPETFDPDKPKLTLNGHLTPQGIEAFKRVIDEKVYTQASLDALLEDCEQNKIKLPTTTPKSAEDWLAAKLREPKEGFAIQLPFIKLENALYYTAKVDGEKVQKTRAIQAWDGHNHKLNLKRLMLGRGSVIEAVVYPNLYFSKVIGVIQPSLKLVGVRVIELVQFQKGGGSAPTETTDEALREVMGRDLVAADLSAFMGDDHEPDEDEEDGLPGVPPKAPKEEKSPAERAKDMF